MRPPPPPVVDAFWVVEPVVPPVTAGRVGGIIMLPLVVLGGEVEDADPPFRTLFTLLCTVLN